MAVDSYSRLIRFLKLALPLSALILLSTLFLLSRERDATEVIPFADSELRERLADQLVTGPVYTGLNSAGDEMKITAETMRSTGEDLHQADRLIADFQLTNGTLVTVEANDGQLNLLRQTAVLTGDVEITTSSGLTFTTDLLDAVFEPLRIVSPGPVEGDAPFGHLNAGAMELTAEPGNTNRRLVFTNGVKLLYQP